jgi:nucleotide-binding universal stress UspA family protein
LRITADEPVRRAWQRRPRYTDRLGGLSMKVLVGIDGREQQRDALALAARLAQVGGGTLLVATVYEWSPWSKQMGDWHREAVQAGADEILQSAGADLAGVRFTTRAFGDLSPARGLFALADAEHPDVIVLGASHRSRIGQALLGSVSARLLHGVPCPVAVAPRGYAASAARLRTIGVAYDGGPEADAALAWAQGLAERCGASLRLLAVVHPVPIATYPGMGSYPYDEVVGAVRRDLQERVDAALLRLPASLEAAGELFDAPVTQGLASAADHVDLLVTGSRGYGPVGATVLGSVSRGLLRKAPCPLVVVPRTAARPAAARDHAAAKAPA